MPAKYATGTQVPVINSRAEMTGVLVKHGVERQAWSTEPGGDTLMFGLGGKVYKFFIQRPTEEDLKKLDSSRNANIDWGTRVEKEWMRRWRANVLLLKAKLEFATDESSSIERELLPYLVLADGRTLDEVVSSGGLPTITGVPLLSAGSIT